MGIVSLRTDPRALWHSRGVEWGVLAVCIALVTGVLWQYAQQVRAQAERAAVQSTLGALRTALVLDYVRGMLPVGTNRPAPGAASQEMPNPFRMLQQPAANYAGEIPAALMQEVAPGRWVFDRRCACVGYKPQDAAVLDAPTGAQTLWFAIETTGGAPQLRPIQAYRWAGVPLE